MGQKLRLRSQLVKKEGRKFNRPAIRLHKSFSSVVGGSLSGINVTDRRRVWAGCFSSPHTANKSKMLRENQP
jgi:hypothetical protein